MSAFEKMPRITPFLWFDNKAEEAVDFYCSVFRNSRKLNEVRNPDKKYGPSEVLTIAFELDGQKFTALNGGPVFKFTEAISLVVRCETQAEIDEYWEKLTSGGGQEGQCGWLKDRFELSWQVVPASLPELVKSPKVLQALQKMKKLELPELERAAEG